MRANQVQLVCGLSSGLLGVILPFVGLRFVLVENGDDPFHWSTWALLASLPVGIAIVALMNGILRSFFLVGLLWLLALLLLAFSIIGSVTFGFFLLPSALLGIGAAVAASMERHNHSRQEQIVAHR